MNFKAKFLTKMNHLKLQGHKNDIMEFIDAYIDKRITEICAKDKVEPFLPCCKNNHIYL